MKLKYHFWMTAMIVLGIASGAAAWAETRGSRIYPQGRLKYVSKVTGQAKKVGIKRGDFITRYNDIPVASDDSWDKLKQTVVADTVVLEVLRNGQPAQFTLKKDSIGVYDYAGDYVSSLKPNQFLINGELNIPRADARKFKQNYLNGFVTAELEIRPVSPKLCLVTKAVSSTRAMITATTFFSRDFSISVIG